MSVSSVNLHGGEDAWVDSATAIDDRPRVWRASNTRRLTDDDRRLGHDSGGFCAEHNRWLTYPEQRRGACSWCVPVDPEPEPDYWAGRWRRVTAR